MKIIRVALKNNSYEICVGTEVLGKLGAKIKKMNFGKDAFIVTTANINKLYGAKLRQSLKKSGFTPKVFEVPDGEKSKSVKTAFDLIGRIARYDVLKKPFIVAFGGGVIGDLAGYVASTYKRGIPYIQVPTTFLAQVDSAIGGKVAIDLPVGKNLVGAFYQPRLVWSDVSLLLSLNQRQLRNGLAEAVKYGVIADKKLFENMEDNFDLLLERDLKVLTDIVERCARIKAQIVVKDEKETKGIRTILNFGHTVGHAIETAGRFNQYQHGEGVALGMRIAVAISEDVNGFSVINGQRINDLLTNIGLPQKVKKINASKILKLMQHDKKFQSGKNRFVLVERIGQVNVIEGVSQKLVRASIERCC